MKSLSEIMQNEQSNAFRLYGAFFAFGNQQFNEKATPGIHYTSLGYGLICPSIWCNALESELDNIYNASIKFQVESYGAEEIIRYEYFNHETQLSGDRTSLLDSISGHIKLYPELFTANVIDMVCKRCFSLAVQNDWF